MAELYNAMDVFVLPSFYEGLPVVGVEVQANGLPFLCSDQVTKEILVSKSIKQLSLDSGATSWASKAINTKRENIGKITRTINNAGFDIEHEARNIQEQYIEMTS